MTGKINAVHRYVPGKDESPDLDRIIAITVDPDEGGKSVKVACDGWKMNVGGVPGEPQPGMRVHVIPMTRIECERR